MLCTLTNFKSLIIVLRFHGKCHVTGKLKIMSQVLSAEQKNFLEECEIEYSTRYTIEDEDYKKIFENDIPPPPIMTPWHGRQKLQARRRFGNRYNSGHNNDYNERNRDQRDDRYYSRNRHNNYDNRYRY